MPMKPAEFAACIKKGIVRWTALAKACNIQFDYALRPDGAVHGSQLSGCPIRRRYCCLGAVALDGGFCLADVLFIVKSPIAL